MPETNTMYCFPEDDKQFLYFGEPAEVNKLALWLQNNMTGKYTSSCTGGIPITAKPMYFAMTIEDERDRVLLKLTWG